MFAVAEHLGAVFTVTAPQRSNVRAAALALAADPTTICVSALAAEADKGSEIAPPPAAMSFAFGASIRNEIAPVL